jgi:ATP-binding cassette, subfamily B, bacterial AbcA/BmrA
MENEHHVQQDEQQSWKKEKTGKRPDKAGMSRFIKLIASAHPPKAILTIAMILTLVQTMAGLIVPLMTKGLIDGLTLSSLNRMVIFGLLGAFVLQAVASAVSIYMLNYAGHKIVANLRKRLWHKILSLPIPYFDRNRSGDTMSRVTNDTSLIMSLITEYLVNLISNVIAIIGGITLLFYFH